jgi:prevent-host-death family protein
MIIPASVFKAQCLKLMDEVARTGQPVVITKRGKPVAQLVPVPAEPKSMFGYMRSTVTITGDVVAPIEEPWSAVAPGRDPFVSAARSMSRVHRAGLKK